MTAYGEDQWFGFSYRDDPVSGCALTLLPIETSLPRFIGPFSPVGTERGAGGWGEESEQDFTCSEEVGELKHGSDPHIGAVVWDRSEEFEALGE